MNPDDVINIVTKNLEGLTPEQLAYMEEYKLALQEAIVEIYENVKKEIEDNEAKDSAE